MDLVLKIGDDGVEIARVEATEHEADLPLEYCQYRDEGCKFADSCLNCLCPECLYEQPRKRQRWLKELRNREISRFFGEGWGVKELALLLGLS